MGLFNSLKCQVGRTTGGVIWNTLFGNKHASKYQRVNSSDNISKNLKLEKKYELELLEKERENNLEVLNRNQELFEINEKTTFVNQNLKKITSMKVPSSKEAIIDNLHSLSVEITSNKWKDTDDEINKISNVYTEALFKKYEQHLFTLKNKFPTAIEIQYFEKQNKSFQKHVFFQKYKLAFIAIPFIIFIIWGITSGYFERSDKETRQRNNELIDKILK